MSSRPEKYNLIGDEMRKLICSHFEDDMSPKEISECTKVAYRTVLSVLKVYKISGRVEKSKNRHRNPKKLSESDREFLRDLINEDCSLTNEYLRKKILDERSVNVSTRTIGRVFKEFHYSMKRTSLIPVARNSLSNIESRYQYALRFCEFDEEKTYFIDEAGFQINMRRNYGRAPLGRKAIKIVPKIRMKNYSLEAVINKSCLYFFEVMDCAYNVEHFGDFLDKFLSFLDRDGVKNAFLVMDNVRFHHNSGIREKIELKNHSIVFIPPYSPFLNPIEEVFAQWKSIVRKANCQTENDLYQEIHNASDEISPSDCASYFDHMESFIRKSLEKEKGF